MRRSKGYLAGSIFHHPYSAHRVIWAIVHGEWPDNDVDHINRNRMDNRLVNLRLAKRCDNCRNRTSRRGSLSKYLGVSFDKSRNRWLARIGAGKDRKVLHIGSFATEEEAARAYDAVAAVRHGDFANLNFPT